MEQKHSGHTQLHTEMGKHIEPPTTDPFYGEQNMAHLRRWIIALNAGKGSVHELLPDEDE